MTARALLAIGREDLRSRVLALFAELGEEIDVLGVAENSADLLLAVEAQPDLDIVFIDEQIGSLPALALTREVVSRVPHIGVILMSNDLSTSTYQAAMDAGARAVVESPPSIGDLSERLPQIMAWQRQLRGAMHQTGGGADGAGRMIAFVGAKGGVGTSTLAVHTALVAASSNPERRVALVDLDLQQRGITQVIEIPSRRTISDLVTVSESLTGRNLDEATMVHRSGLRILLAPEQGEHSEDIDGQVARQILAACKGHYDLVILDCGSVVTEANAVGMEFADELLLVTTPDVACLRAAQDKHDLLSRLQIVKESGTELLFNRVSQRNEVQPEFGARMAIAGVQKVNIPEDWKNLEQTANALSPFELEDCPFRRGIVALARSLELTLPARSAAGSPESLDPDQAPSKRRRRRGKQKTAMSGEAGQSTVEAIVGITVALIFLLIIVQVGFLALGSVVARRAADEAARVHSRGGSLAEAKQAAEDKIPDIYGLSLQSRSDGDFKATVSSPRVMPFLDRPVTAIGSAASEE